MPKITINKFNGGMVNDPLSGASNACMVATNFDLGTNPSKLIPNRATESGYSGQSTGKLQNFCLGYRSASSGYVLFGLGVVSGQVYANVLFKTLDSLDTDSWSTPANNASASGETSFNLFVYYRRTGLIYGAKAGTHIWAYDTNGSAFAETHQALSYTTIGQGLVHSKDDILYIPYDNKIAVNNNGSWTASAITVPEEYTIASISEYGNYLALACTPKNAAGNSRLYLWDRNTSLTTLTESVDLGYGNVKVIEEIEGTLIAISIVGGTSTSIKDKIVFRYLAGNQMIKFGELVSSSTGTTSATLSSFRHRANAKLYFMLKMYINGAIREGVFSIGRNVVGGQMTIAHEYTLNNSTATTITSTPLGFFAAGDYMFISYVDNSTYYLRKTDDQSTFTTSIYESLINPGMSAGDMAGKKQLIGIAVNHEPLTSNQTVVLKYRVDSANTGAWTTVYTSSTVGDTRFETGLDASGTQFTAGVNYEFRLESTAGAVITGFSYVYENILELV